MTKVLFLAPILALNASCLLRAQDATEIIRQSVDRDATNFERFKNYTFLERVEERRYGRNGKLSSKEIETYEFMVLGGVRTESWWSAMINLCPPRKPARNRKKWRRSQPSGSANLNPTGPGKIRIAPRSAAICGGS